MKEFVEKLIEMLEDEKAKEMIFGFKNIDNPFKKGCIDNRVFAYDKAIKIVNQLAEEYSTITPQSLEDGWIPCSERLPEEDGYYLTTTIFYHLYNPVVMGCNFEDGRWLYMNSDDEVIAWQPLPQPYKEGSE